MINFILKKNSSGGTVDATYGGFFDGGGSTTKVDANAGFAPIENSFFNLTAQISNHGHTDRGNPDPRTDPAYWTGSYPNSNIPLVPGYPDINHIQGDAENTSSSWASTPGSPARRCRSLRQRHLRHQGFTVLRELSRSQQGGLRSNNRSGIGGGGRPDAANSRHDHSYLSLPLGFNPLEESKENDFQLVAGVKGSIADWTWDLAEAYGEDHMEVYTINSANATLYADTGSTPTDFYDGKFISTQSTTTLDITKDFELGMAGPLTLAFGGEHRRESWVLGPGEPNSYIGGGAQSFPGYSATIATNAARHSDAGYSTWPRRPSRG